MAEEKIEKFELDTIVDVEHGVLEIKGGFENTIALATEIINQNPVFEIQNDSDKKRAKEIRASLNKVVKAIDRRRIDTITDFTTQFTTNCNAVKKLFEDRAAEFAQVINAYEESQKVVVGGTDTIKKYTATIKFTDEKLKKKLTDFCTKYGCELTIK